MKKRIILYLVILVIPSVLAINVTIEKTSEIPSLIPGIDEPAVFDLQLTNNEKADNFLIYNLLGFKMEPEERVRMNKGATRDIELKIYPRQGLDYRGFYTLEIFIMGADSSRIKEDLTMKIIDLEDAFEIGSGEVDPESSSMTVYIENKEKINFEELDIEFSSAFFNFKENNITLTPKEKKQFTVQLNREDFKKLQAGFYTMEAEISIENQKADLEGKIKFLEKDILTETKKQYGLIVFTKLIEKTNEGNTITKSETTIKKNIISRMFTTFKPEPDIAEREGFIVYYTWENEIKPGETLEIKVKTNWLFPFLIIILIIAVVIVVKKYSATNLTLKKKVSFVKAKGGEFALKVTLVVHAKKYVERVNIIDRLPALVKVYERFGSEQPKKVDEKNRRIEWGYEKLEEGEMRIINYIIYSKVGVLGKFALPSATAVFERKGNLEDAESNRAFFVAEQRKGDLDDDEY